MTTTVDEAALTADEILTYGPLTESAPVWSRTVFLAQERAPIAVAAGRPRLGPVFNENGVGRAVLIRPCMSRGRRLRGFAPVYTPQMLERDSGVFSGWPMYMDHVPAALAEALARRGRSVRDLGGQVLTPAWRRDFVMEDDELYGYQPGGVLSEIVANDFMQKLVGRNPGILHTSISAWPRSGRPGPVPWNPKLRGMILEGIRRQPQGSVDFVPRGGAGGRLLLAESDADGQEAGTGWPEIGWTEEDRAFVVSLAESVYASADMSGTARNQGAAGQPDLATMTPDSLRTYIRENASHLAPALAEGAVSATPTPAATVPAPTPTGVNTLTIADVKGLIAEHNAEQPDVDRLVEERFEALVERREEEQELRRVAHGLIESAEGLLSGFKTELKARYDITADGPREALLVTETDMTDAEGRDLTAVQVVEARVKADLLTARNILAEAQGKPRVTGEGNATKTTTGDERAAGAKVQEGEEPYWRSAFVELDVAESAEAADAVYGIPKVEG